MRDFHDLVKLLWEHPSGRRSFWTLPMRSRPGAELLLRLGGKAVPLVAGGTVREEADQLAREENPAPFGRDY